MTFTFWTWKNLGLDQLRFAGPIGFGGLGLVFERSLRSQHEPHMKYTACHLRVRTCEPVSHSLVLATVSRLLLTALAMQQYRTKTTYETAPLPCSAPLFQSMAGTSVL